MFKRRPRAGAYAEQRYRRGLRSWRARNRWLFAVLCGPFIAAGIVVGVLSWDFLAWTAGFVVGAFATLWITFRDTPPRYVESWRDGAEGERKAEKALKPLERDGWHVVHDIQNGRGNYDHVAVGPGGTYLLESKNLQGVVSVQGGVPHLARRHDPEQAVVFDRVRPLSLASAARLKSEIEQRTGHRIWVQAVVVFWSEFPQGLIEDDRCVFIDGSQLCSWLQSQPTRLSRAEVEKISVGIETAAEDSDPFPVELETV
jgi:Nuclease-related domain